jgi:Tol biopolymer transport system component/DNA-binding winged helix-turn-helix (wHTH) protein
MTQSRNSRSGPQTVRFSEFKLDLRAGELFKDGARIRLQDQPLQILVLLTRRAGEVVTRDELRQHLWPADTFVDFDNSLNAAIAKIREALTDSPEAPRFIETLPRRGYRFIARVEPSETFLPQALPRGSVSPPVAANKRRGQIWWISAVLGVSFLLTAWFLFRSWRFPETPRVIRYIQITNDGKPKARPVSFLNILLNDNSRIYFSLGTAKGWELAQVSAQGGEAVTVPLPVDGIVPCDISRDHSKLLLGGGAKGTELPGSPFWVLPLPGGPIERLGEVRARGASWSPDGRLLAYAQQQALYIANADGSESRRLATFEASALQPFQPRWSPDSKVLRFYLYNTKTESGGLWEISADGSNPRALFPAWPADSETCCGVWTSDGTYFVFQATRGGLSNIWLRRERTEFFHKEPPEPTQLTFGPMSFLGPNPSPDGKQLFAIGVQERGELMRYDSVSRQFVTYLSGVSVQGLDFSLDGQWVVYTTYPEGTLWRSRIDGSQRIQLTHEPLQVALPRWSPDGKSVAFMAAKPGNPPKICLMPSEGGRIEELFPSEESQWHPNWSPKGDALIFGNPWWSVTPAIHFLNTATRRLSTLPGSEGLYSPRWSPDGRYVAAVGKDLRRVMLFDFTTQQWQELAVMDSVGHVTWARKGEYVYFDAATEDAVSIYRVGAHEHKLERVALIPPHIGPPFELFSPWTGLAPDDSPLLMRDTSIQEIYALDWKLP